MKKTLVALAALASVSAFAQSAISIYGSVDAGIRNQSVADTKGNSVQVFQSGAIKSNRIGFEGKEDLGAGMYSSFRLESNMDVNIGTQGGFISGSNGNRVFDREAWVKLGNGNGALTIGRQYHPVFRSTAQFLPLTVWVADTQTQQPLWTGVLTQWASVGTLWPT